MKNTKEEAVLSARPPFTHTIRKLSVTASLKGEAAVGRMTAVPGEYGIFIPLLFSTQKSYTQFFCDM